VTVIRETVALVLGLDPADVTESTSPASVDGWDSARFVELVLALEEKLGFQFSAEEIAAIQTVGDIEALTAGRISGTDGRF
jgi:acyl carrier protein